MRPEQDASAETLRKFLRDAALGRGQTLTVKVQNGEFNLAVDVLCDLLDELGEDEK